MKLLKRPKERNLLIYTVDDDEYYTKLIKVNLEKLGYNDIISFKSGEECLLEMSNKKPDCVILDYLLKDGLNGDEVLERINNEYKDVEVIILSGQEDVEVATNIIRQGATDYVVKNKMSFFNIGNTLNKIKKIVNSRELDLWKTRRIKLLLVLSIIFVWIIGGLLIYIKFKNGMLF